jgi:hypothetical protein
MGHLVYPFNPLYHAMGLVCDIDLGWKKTETTFSRQGGTKIQKTTMAVTNLVSKLLQFVQNCDGKASFGEKKFRIKLVMQPWH